MIVRPADFDAWLAPGTSPDALQAILARASAEGLRFYPVSPLVNSVRNDDASLIEDSAA
ncbi:hypothetical protein D3C83_173370 [compost metagenome]